MATQHQHDRRMVAGLFHNPPQAEHAVRELQAAGFTKNDIGIATRDRAQRDLLDRSTGMDVEASGAKAAKGGARGVMDTIASWFNPDSSGSLAGILSDQGFSPNVARQIDEGFQAGMILVTVQASDRDDVALGILRDASEMGQPAASRGVREADRAAQANRTDLTEAQRLQLREEELQIGKRQVPAGEVRVRKEVVSEQRTVDVPVTREELVIERHPADQRTAASGNLDQGEEIRIPLMQEEVDVQKRAVVREEVSIGKREVTDTEQVSETVRREELQVGNEGDVSTRTTGTPGRRPAYSGKERRRRPDPSYSGPERRAAFA